MFTICDLQLEPGRFHYITDLKFLSHASVTTVYSINLGSNINQALCMDCNINNLNDVIFTRD